MVITKIIMALCMFVNSNLDGHMMIKDDSVSECLKLKREAEFYVEMCKKEKYLSSNYLHIKSVDIQITERCSAKCKNCSNLMQYLILIKITAN